MTSFGKNLKIWGLTGGIASGKSSAAQVFQDLGFAVLDADQLVKELSAPGGAAAPEIQKRFGTLDRKKIREIVFQDPEAKKDLEAILHPKVQEESRRRFQKMAHQSQNDDAFYGIYEATLLVETGRYKDFEGLIVVSADEDIRRKRLEKRFPQDPHLAERILRSQIADEKRRKVAHYLIENHGSMENLKAQVERIARQIRA